MGDTGQHVSVLFDPKMAPSRIFVKHLPKTGLTRLELHEHFSKHGKILGINYQADYAFIQYDSNAQADAAVQAETFTYYKGNMIKVFKARVPSDRMESNKFREDPPYYYSPEPPPPRPQPVGPPPVACSEDERAHDCEIIVHDKSQRAYAEMIERNLVKMGLKVNIIFPSETIPVLTLLNHSSTRGTLYAITISPQHELKASMTVNILHGENPEEHRNMPINKAVVLLAQNFERYLASGGNRQGDSTSSADLPEGIENMLNLLSQSKPLTVMQYEALTKFLIRKRELQVKLELGNTQTDNEMDTTPSSLLAATPTVTATPAESQAEQLQKRILSIMNKKIAVPEPPKPTPILQDPKVQLALSSLFSDNFF
ncbi:nuclear receptor coactivator 5-like [Cloeon dipterum]|uniref:nuclear receptor coactivator 5-like n=1 Tax=Cloeon dipterum TaxID=197152 RepID=UPI0032200778